MTGPERLEDLFRSTVRVLEDGGNEYAVIGALARNAWARPRATTDADFAVALDAPALARLLDGLAAVGLVVRKTAKEDPADPVPDLLLLQSANEAGLRVDFLVAKTPFEQTAMGRRRSTTLAGVPCRVVSPEDLIVYKLISGRTRDLADAEEVAQTRRAAGEPVDWEYVERWAREFDAEPRARRLRERIGD